MPFSDPGNTVDVANTVALTSGTIAQLTPPTASQIGSATSAAGSKLISPSGTVSHKGFSGLGDSVVIDCTEGVSIALDFLLNSVPGSTPGSATFSYAYTDATQTETIFEETIELNCGVNSTVGVIQSCIMDRVLGPQCEIALDGTTGVVNPVLDLYYLVQNVPVDSRRVVESGVSQEGDGLLGTFTDASLAAGATSALHVFQSGHGEGIVRVAATIAGTFTFKWGYGGLQPWAVAVAAGVDEFLPLPIQLVNRPLAYTVKNTGASAGTFTASLYSTPA